MHPIKHRLAQTCSCAPSTFYKKEVETLTPEYVYTDLHADMHANMHVHQFKAKQEVAHMGRHTHTHTQTYALAVGQREFTMATGERGSRMQSLADIGV